MLMDFQKQKRIGSLALRIWNHKEKRYRQKNRKDRNTGSAKEKNADMQQNR